MQTRKNEANGCRFFYVDGGKNLILEHNHVFNCNFGVELASEWPQGATEDITVRDNLIHDNFSAGIIMGGYDEKRGKARVEVANNTFYNASPFALAAGSPCIDAGNPASDPASGGSTFAFDCPAI